MRKEIENMKGNIFDKIRNCFPEGPNDGGNWDTYEEALEARIIKALKLI